MGTVKVTLKLRGINAVMTSPGVVAEVTARAQRIKKAAGDHFEVAVRPHRYTARAFVRSADFQGAHEEARDKRLTRAIDAGR
jgi:hypothetical protein